MRRILSYKDSVLFHKCSRDCFLKTLKNKIRPIIYMRNFLAMAFLTVIILSYMMPAAFSEISDKNSVKLQNGIWQAKVGKQMQIQADVTNGQDRVQPFAYI